jgi:hypothetical protein
MTSKRFFLGKNDPNRISLENVFPIGNLVFSMPIGIEQGRHHRIVVEGTADYLQSFSDHANRLIGRESDFAGRWIALTDYDLDSSRVLLYEPKCHEAMKAVQLLVLILRNDLIQFCNLRLSNAAVVTGTRGWVTFLNNRVSLPSYIANGSLDVAPLIAPPARCPAITIN